MKRWIKNWVLILVMIICLIVVVFAGIYASKKISTSGGNPPSEIGFGNEVPERPDGDTDNQAPEKPDGENNNGSVPEMPGENMGMPRSNSSLSVKYYVIFGVAGFGFTASAVYLLMSKFNKLTIRETFVNGDKVLIFILTSLLFTGIVTFVSSYVVKNNSCPLLGIENLFVI